MKKNLIALSITAACLLCMTGCGGTESIQSGKIQISSAEKSEAEQSKDEASSNEVSLRESNTEPTTQTDPSESAAIQTTASETEPQNPAVPDSQAPLSEKAKFVYQGCTFAVGDLYANIAEKLGKQVAPSETVKPCIPGAGTETHYMYPGFTVAVTEKGVITSIVLNHDFDPSNEAGTVSGLHLGDKKEQVDQLLGKPDIDIEGMIYTYQQDDLTLSFDFEEDIITSVRSENNQLLFD